MIIYDLTSLQYQGTVKAHGGGTFAKYVLNRLLERDIKFVSIWDSSRGIENEIIEKVGLNKIPLIDVKNCNFEHAINDIPNPLVFSILPQNYMLVVPTVGTIHDCRECELPNDPWEVLYKIKIRRLCIKIFNFIFPGLYKARNIKILAKKIGNKNFIGTTITKFSQERLKFYFDKEYPIFSTPFSIGSEKAPKCKEVDRKFFLLVSCDRWLKNNLRVIRAFDRLISQNKLNGYNVKLVGINNLTEYKIKIKNKDRFETLGYIDQDSLNRLFKEASVFIFPSLYEGFGIPPLEAFQYGTPVIASKLSSIPEVCEDAALYINPFSIKDIMGKILYMLQKRVYEEYSNKAIERFNSLISNNMKSIDAYIDFVISTEKKIYG